MTAQPVAGYASDTTNRDEGDMAQLWEDMISISKEMPGGEKKYGTIIPLNSDAFTPLANYCMYQIDTQGATAADDLVNITATNMRDGEFTGFHIANNARVITIKTTGNIQTPNGRDIVCNDTRYEYWFRYDAVIGKHRLQSITHELLRLDQGLGTQKSATNPAMVITGGQLSIDRAIVQTMLSQVGVTDDLDYILQTTINNDGAIILIRPSSGHTITMRHMQGASPAGQIFCLMSVNVVLNDKTTAILVKNGAQWQHIGYIGTRTLGLAEGGTNNAGLNGTAKCLLVGNGSGQFVELTAPASGLQDLRSNAGNTALEWYTPTANTKFKSTNQSITGSGTLTLAHGLGAKPDEVWMKAICTTADIGYSVGDEILMYHNDAPSNTNQGACIVADTTNLNVKFPAGNGGSVFQQMTKSTGAWANAANGSWQLQFMAR